MSGITFRKRTVGTVPNDCGINPMNTLHVAGDVNNDGRLDIVVSGRHGRMVWLENQDEDQPWVEHVMDDDLYDIGCCGSLVDLTGTGFPDLIVGSGGEQDEIWWFSFGCSKRPGTIRYRTHLIALLC